MLFSNQDLSAADFLHVSVIAPPSHFQMRRTKNVNSQLLNKIVRSCNVGFLKQACMVRVSDYFFIDGIASRRICVSYRKAKCVVRSAFHFGFEMSFFFVEKGFTIGDQIL